MKKWFIILATIALGTSAFAADNWSTDFKGSLAKAKSEGKYVLVDFSGSDWCGWCMRLDEEVFSQKAFQDYAKENLILVILDFPNDRSKQTPAEIKQNQELAKKFNIKGFPTVLILDPEGKIIERTGYRSGGAEAYVTFIKSVISKSKPKK